MQASVVSDSAVERTSSTPSTQALTRYVVPAAFLGVLWFVLCRHLSSEWSLNEQYSYGWFVPFFAAYLFWLRWEDRPAGVEARVPTRNNLLLRTAAATAFLLLPALLPVRLFEVGNPDWRPLGWIHSAIVVAVTLLVLWRIGGIPWLKHFAFPVCFILVAVPWVSGIETPIIQGLMRGVAAVAAETLNLFGVPAQLEGNLIRINSGLVGVNEACSGVRSLQTSLMIGLLFGELKRLALVRRVLLVCGAVAIALVANCLRALFLVWVAADQQTSAVSRWHDIAGYSIVLAVFAGTMLLARLLSRNDVERARRELATRQPFILRPSSFILPLVWLVAVEAGVETWYRAHERNLIAEQSWTVQWPTSAPAFHDMQIDEGVRRTLRFDDGREATWMIAAHEPPLRAYAFFFRWNAGGSSVVRARAHRPDICLPSVGWTMAADQGTKEYRIADIAVPFRRNVFRKEGTAATAYAFFCLQEDRRRPNESRPDLEVTGGAQPDWSFRERARIVREGIRNLGQQVLEIILLSPAPIEPEKVDAEFAALLQPLVRPGRTGNRS